MYVQCALTTDVSNLNSTCLEAKELVVLKTVFLMTVHLKAEKQREENGRLSRVSLSVSPIVTFLQEGHLDQSTEGGWAAGVTGTQHSSEIALSSQLKIALG